jgi:hypothetical protein
MVNRTAQFFIGREFRLVSVGNLNLGRGGHQSVSLLQLPLYRPRAEKVSQLISRQEPRPPPWASHAGGETPAFITRQLLV